MMQPMAEPRHIYIFGDQTFDYGPKLRDLVRSKDHYLISFFEQVYSALRQEINDLPTRTQQDLGRFSNFAELVANSLNGPIHPSLEQTLTCTFQLASFIRSSHKEPYPHATNTYVVGLCTGALAAAAVASATSLTNLLPVAVRSAVVAFRTGLCAAETARSISIDCEDFKQDWSFLCVGLDVNTVKEGIEAFAASENHPLPSRPYVSASSDNGVTVTGPPVTLKALCRNHPFTKGSTIPLRIRVPYHAAHIFSGDNVEDILSTTSSEKWNQAATLPVISSANGETIWAANFRSLLRAAVNDILLRQLRWDKVRQRLNTFSVSSYDVPIISHHFAVTAESAVRGALEQGSGTSTVIVDGTAMQDSQTSDSMNRTGRPEKSKIAIIGASGRFPGADDMESFWDLLYDGLDVHKTVPPLHWDAKTHVDPEGKRKNTSATPYGCWLDHPDMFDARFFNISPREAPHIDPAQRLALMTAYEAIEDAGITPAGSPSTQKDRVGVFYGVTSNDWMETNSAQNIDTYFIPGGNRAFIPGRVNYFFRFSGPSFSVDTACSSSLAAIHLACNALWRGEIDTAIAGGTNVLTNPDFTAGLDRGHFLSRTGNCKTFDDDADGYCRGEGVATIVLKRVEDAIIDRDPIQGIICGGYTNHSADAESITRPHVAAQKDIFRKVLSSAGVDPFDIGYVEMHGTGTQAGDGAEMSSVLETFAPNQDRWKRKPSQDLYVGSAKSNIGHGEAASGVCSLAKVLLMMRNDTIPPHCGIKNKINHTFPTDLEERRAFIANKPTHWNRPDKGVRKVFLNNFSAAGGNTALLLEDAPVLITDGDTGDQRSTHVVAISAKCATSLRGNASMLLDYLDHMNSEDLPKLSYTTTARRMHHAHRIMVQGKDVKMVRSDLERAIEAQEGSTRPKVAPKPVFAFTGQGSAYAGMAEQLFVYESFRKDIDRCDRTAQTLGFPSFRSVYHATQGDIQEFSPLVSQLAIVCMEMALARLWNTWGVSPSAVVGHSLGEYAALNYAGVISDADTIYLVGRRAQLLEERCTQGTHCMLAIRASRNAIAKALDGAKFDIACVNGPEDIVVSGTERKIQEIQQLLSKSRIKSTMLNVPYAFHSAQVDPIITEYQQIAQSVSYHRPVIPILSPSENILVEKEDVVGPQYLANHCRKAVDLHSVVMTARERGFINDKTMAIEIGPQPVVCSMIKASVPTINALPSLKRKTDVWETVTQTLSALYVAGAELVWKEYHRDFKFAHQVLKLPAYNWDLKSYWMQYVNDWSLRKGDPPQVLNAESIISASSDSHSKDDPVRSIIAPATPVPRLESTTIHRVVKEDMNSGHSTLVIESDISRSDLNPMVQGHKVNGVPLCTPSVYADIALSVGKHLQIAYWPDIKDLGIAVSDMTIVKALIAAPSGPQLLHTIVEPDASLKIARCRFQSVDPQGKFKYDHATCEIRFQGQEALKELQQRAKSVRARINALRNGTDSGSTYIFNQAMIYKMVATLANFDPKYRALREIVLDSTNMDASSVADFGGIKAEGKFHTNPAYIDALSQSAGFVMNCNDGADLDVEVFVNHGWQSFQLFEELSTAKKYQTHVAMVERNGKAWGGDLLILDGDRVVGAFKGIVLQGVPRRLLHFILASESNEVSGNKNSVSKTSTKPRASTPASSQRAVALQSDKIENGKSPPKTNRDGVKSRPTSEVTPSSAPSSTVPIPKQAKSPSEQEGKAQKKALLIVSEESGLAIEELTDDTVLADSGIDSLLSLMITSRFRDELDVELDSSAFSELEKIKDLKSFFSNTGHESTGEEEQDDEMHTTPAQDAELNEGYVSGQELAQTPSPDNDPSRGVEIALEPEVITDQANSSSPSLWTAVLKIISEETGIGLDDLVDDTDFADSGVDSLLSLMISSRLREDLGMDVNTDGSLFSACETLQDLKKALVLEDKTDHKNLPSTSSSSSTNLGSLGSPMGDMQFKNVAYTPASSESEDYLDIDSSAIEVRRATSIVLQGRPSSTKNTLFLFPDGAGSAHSYSNIPKISNDLAVIGLNCPFVRHPHEMSACPLDNLIKSYIDEVKRRQPKGPYNFGGWSAGGILAYRACQILLEQGQVVERLVLIDSPIPKGLDKLPQRFYDHCKACGVFGQASSGPSPLPTEQLFAHFNGTIEVLHNYYAKPLPRNALKKVTVIWAEECVLDGIKFPKLPPGPDDNEGMKFLTEQRTDFTAAGWEAYFPGAKLKVKRSERAHHFSMMQGEHAEGLARMVGDAIDV